MIKRILSALFCLSILFVGAQLTKAEIKKDVLGLYIGMEREAAIKLLQKIGKKNHDERKQQEIWALSNNSQFSHVIIAFDKEYKKVRFVTAKARENGKRVRYADVLDTRKAVQMGSGGNYNYVLEVPERSNQPGYKIIARGTDKNYLTYFAVEEIEIVQK